MCHEDIVKVITGVEDPEEVEEEAREVIKVTKNQAIVASLLTFIEQRDSDVMMENFLVSKIKSFFC